MVIENGNMKKKIVIFKEESSYDIPEKASEFIAYFQEKIATIPDECLETARIEIEADVAWDWPQLSVEIYYERDETEEEAIQREQQKANREAQTKSRELAELERIKKKYGV